MGTPKLNPHFLEFSKCLGAHDVRYLLIGGYAVGFHGWPRNTKDIDFWIAGDEENQARVIHALREFGFPHAEDDLLREDSVIVRFGVPPFRIEIIRKISGVSFESLILCILKPATPTTTHSRAVASSAHLAEPEPELSDSAGCSPHLPPSR